MIFALFLPRGIWGSLEDRFGIRLLPVGYRLKWTKDSNLTEAPGTPSSARRSAMPEASEPLPDI
jgi:branched-chain amino acid transport system permease protein